MKNQIRYQLLRPKQVDYKKPGSMPVTIEVGSGSEKKAVQDMEIICTDYPLKMPVILYNQNQDREMEFGSPMIVYKGELYGIYSFIQVRKDLINIFVLYAGDPKKSPICKIE